MNKNVQIVEGKDFENKDVKIVVKRPSVAQITEGQMVESRIFNEGIQQGTITRGGLEEHMRKTGQWDDTKEKEIKELSLKILAGERQLARGARDSQGETVTKKQMRDLSLEIRGWRTDQLILLAKTRELDSFTVEGKAENSKFDYFMSVCIFNEDETLHFQDIEDYKNRANEDSPYINKAAGELANMHYNYDPESEKKKAENRFLVKYGFAREEDGALVNDDGHLVDSEGTLVNEEGRLVNADDEYIDVNGDLVDFEGNPIEDFVEFDEKPKKEKKTPLVKAE